MAITFSGQNSELYEITNVNQLVGLRSQKDRSFRLTVKHTNIDDAIYTSVIVYNEEKNTDIISLLTDCENDVLGVSDAIISRDNLVIVLAAFGFNISFAQDLQLTPDTVAFLTNIYNVGYRYFNFTSDGMLVYMSDNLKNPENANTFTNYNLCDFSRFLLEENMQPVYNIGDYI